MKKGFKKLFSVILTVVMLSLTLVPAFAMEQDSWETVWSSEDAQAGLFMFVGSDESERNFSWYTDDQNTPKVLLGTNASLSDADRFEGTSEKASDGDFVNLVTVTDLEADTV